ncbi:inorganic phosphate cotransporter, partial [Trichonephila clavata]
ALGFCLCMVGILSAGCDTVINVLCFSLSLLSSGIALAGIMIAVGDMSPMFSGTLMGIASTVASLSTVIIPLITGYLTTHETLAEWHVVFWISLGIVGSSGAVYVLFGSAEVQSWNFIEGGNSIKTTNKTEKQNDKNLEL